MTLVDIALGVVIGLVAATVAFELGIKKFLPKSMDTTWTKRWDLRDVGPNPLVVTEKITGVELPEGSRVLIRSKDSSIDAVPDGVQVKQHPKVRGNYVVGKSRALIFNSVIHPDAPAVNTVDDAVVDKLHREFDRLWYGEERQRGEPAHDDVVSAEGVVVGVEQTDGGWLAKLSSQGKLLPVAVAEGQDLEGQAVRVSGQVVYQDGQRVLQADEVERQGPAR